MLPASGLLRALGRGARGRPSCYGESPDGLGGGAGDQRAGVDRHADPLPVVAEDVPAGRPAGPARRPDLCRGAAQGPLHGRVPGRRRSAGLFRHGRRVLLRPGTSERSFRVRPERARGFRRSGCMDETERTRRPRPRGPRRAEALARAKTELRLRAVVGLGGRGSRRHARSGR